MAHERSDTVRRIFLSSVTAEFGVQREKLRRALSLPRVYVQEQSDFVMGGGKLLEKLDKYIRDCDAVIHIVGTQTGRAAKAAELMWLRETYPDFVERFDFLADEFDRENPTLSYTQLEAWLGLYHNRRCHLYRPVEPADNAPGDGDSQQRHWDHLRDLGEDRGLFDEDEKDLRVCVLRELHDLWPEDIPEKPRAKPVSLPYPPLGSLFKGRDAFLDRLHETLQRTEDGSAAAIVGKAVHGLGGVGKTRLAVEYAWRYVDDYSALLFVVADSPANLRRNLASLVGPLVLNLPEKDATEEEVKVAAALRWLHEHPGWFLIVDNVDTKEAAGAAEEMLANLRGGHVLITGRLASWGGGVEPLGLDVLDAEEAARFLLERTEDRRRKKATDEADAAELAKELDGLALALEQAGAYVARNRMTLADYLGAWQVHEPKVLEWHDERIMKYPRSVAVTWQTTIEQLGPGEVALLRLMTWFAPDPLPLFVFEGEKAEAIWRDASKMAADELGIALNEKEDPTDALATLADYSMVRWDTAAQTVTLHRVVQEILGSRMAKDARDAWLTRSLSLLEAVDLGNPNDVRTWARWNPMQSHIANWVAFGDRAGIARSTSRLMNQLGQILYSKALHAEAEPLMRRALAIDEKSFGPDHPDVARCLNNLAQLLQVTNRLSEAEPLMRRALDIDEKSFGPDHSNVARCLNNLAHLLKVTNRLSEAEPLMRRALAIDEKSFGPDHPDVALDLNNLADLLHATNRLSDAEPLMLRALEIDEKSFGPDHPNVARDLHNLASLLLATNRLSEAEPLMRRALEIDEKSFGPDHPEVAIRLNNLAQLLKATNRQPEAEPLMRRVVEIFREFGRKTGHEHPHMQAALQNYSALLDEMKLSEAEIAARMREVSE